MGHPLSPQAAAWPIYFYLGDSQVENKLHFLADHRLGWPRLFSEDRTSPRGACFGVCIYLYRASKQMWIIMDKFS